jgi:hypothetical protein
MHGVNPHDARSAPEVDEGHPARRRWNPRQLIKAAVYTLLLVNFVGYVANDINTATHTWHAGWSPVDWSKAFATTLDETAWFVLLFLLELETYLLSDEAFTPARVRLMHTLRLLCYLAIAHTVFAYTGELVDLSRAQEYAGATACSFIDGDISFSRNLVYTEIDAANCASLTEDETLYLFAQGQALTDTAGLRIAWELAWVDLVEVVAWLLVLLALEVMVRLQEKGISGGVLMETARVSKVFLYGVLWGAALYWAWRGHWMFVWDEALWILGFIAIGMNLSEWREEIAAHRAEASKPPTGGPPGSGKVAGAA